jgi:hypothetical protein
MSRPRALCVGACASSTAPGWAGRDTAQAFARGAERTGAVRSSNKPDCGGQRTDLPFLAACTNEPEPPGPAADCSGPHTRANPSLAPSERSRAQRPQNELTFRRDATNEPERGGISGTNPRGARIERTERREARTNRPRRRYGPITHARTEPERAGVSVQTDFRQKGSTSASVCESKPTRAC